MQLSSKKLIPYLIVVVPLVLVLSASFFITSFYLNKVKGYFNSAKERSVKERIELKKNESELYAKQINLLFTYKYNKLDEEIKKELEARIDIAYKSARYIYEKYKKKKSSRDIKERIIDALSHMRYSGGQNYAFISDFNGNSILLGNQNIKEKEFSTYLDASNRSIILEEIQAVRRHHKAFIESVNANDLKKEIIYVRDLEAFGWYLGSVIRLDDKIKQLKVKLLDMIKSLPLQRGSFLLLYEADKLLYSSDNSLSLEELQDSKKFYYAKIYFKPLNWKLISGFTLATLTHKDIQKQKDLEKLLDRELDFIIKVSVAIVLFVVLLSLLLSRKINHIFKEYKNEVQEKREALEELNNSLEKRVQEEIKIHTQKEKMLIQSAKMAEMGDMLSMIAHQWRQPLNQLSYIFMNIESAYEYNELSKEYLEKKVKEGTTQLEFMSTTIDEFRSFFKPDKKKEEVLVHHLIQSSVDLLQHSLKAEKIEIELRTFGEEKSLVYKNEFIQVLLNLIKNAKDVLLANKIQDPKITISSYCEIASCVVEVCDNGGGISEELLEKIFEPYFSTKDEKNGTGLGLYMSKMIIEEHHKGRLLVKNSKSGACFKIEI